MAITLKNKGFASHIIGVDSNPVHQQKVLELKLVDEIMTLDSAIKNSEVIILAVPVDATESLLPGILTACDKQVVMDTGSTKLAIVNSIKGHKKRNQFVGTHPMWGTEYSGPEAATANAFVNKAVIICDKDESSNEAIELVTGLYKTLGMHIIFMESPAHDLHTAYISHVSHITSFALANTVLEKEKEEDTIFELASAGFESTVRLAKSNPAMWVPIFKQNRENVLDVLNEHITQLRKFKSCLEKENYDYLLELISDANKIRRIIK